MEETTPDEESILEEVSIKRGIYIDIFAFNFERAVEEYTEIFLKEDIWDMMLYMLLGIILYRFGFFERSIPQSTLKLLALAGILVGLGTHGWINFNLSRPGLDPASEEFYLIFVETGRLPFVLGYLSLIMLLFKSNSPNLVGKWLAATGKLALSNYLLQSVIGAFVFYGFGLAHFNRVDLITIVQIILAASIVQIVFSVYWLKWCRYGPAEWIWRSLTVGSLQPFFNKPRFS